MKRVKGKGARRETLPSRQAMAQLTGGSLIQRSMNSYAKATPAALDVESRGMSLKPRGRK